MADTKTDNLTVMFTDIVGFTAKTAQQSRDEHSQMILTHDKLLIPLVNAFRGKRVKSVGDGMLASFRSPTDAIRCAMALQDKLFEYNQDQPKAEQIHIRAAVNVGEVHAGNNDIFGSAVNVAARVEGIAPGTEIYFTEAVYLSMNKAEVSCEKVGTHDFKGVPDPVTVYRVIRKKPRKASKTGELVYPYGGVHKSVNTGWSANALLKYKVPAIAVTAILLLFILASLLIDTEPDLMVQARSHLADKQYSQLKLLVDKRLLEEPNDPQALLLRGHILYASKQGKEAIKNYALALEVDDQLRNNQIMADNLINSLGRFSDAAQPVLIKFSSPKSIDALAIRATQPGFKAREQAVLNLKTIDKSDRIDQVGRAIQDLEELPSCEQKLSAIQRLRKYKDTRALPAIKNITERRLADRVRYLCLWGEAKATVAELEGTPTRRRQVSTTVKNDNDQAPESVESN